MNFTRHNALATAKSAIEELANSLKIKIQSHNLDGFAGACCDNSVSELVAALRQRRADETDCSEWKITPTQWRTAIRQALENRLYNDHCEIEELRNEIKISR